MKARIKGFETPFREIETLTMKGVNGTFCVDDVEFKGEEDDVDILAMENDTIEDKPKYWELLRHKTAVIAMGRAMGMLSFDYGSFHYIVAEKKALPNEVATFAVECANALIEKLKEK